MKTKLFSLLAIASLLFVSCKKEVTVEVPAPTDITITFAGGVNEFTETMPFASTMKVKANITSKVGLESIVYVKLFRSANKIVMEPISIPDLQQFDYDLNVEVEIDFFCYTYEFMGIQVLAFNKEGEAASKTFSCTNQVLDDPDHYRFSNRLLQNFLSGTYAAGYTPEGNNYFASTLEDGPIIDYVTAKANQSKIEFFSVGVIDGATAGQKAASEYGYGLMSAAKANSPETMRAYGLTDFVGMKHTFFAQLSNNATDNANFDKVMNGELKLEDIVAAYLKAGKFPLSEQVIWIPANTILLVKIGGGILLPTDVLSGDPAAIADLTTSRWGLIRVIANWDTSGGTPSGRPALIDQTMAIDVVLQKPSNAGIPATMMQ